MAGAQERGNGSSRVDCSSDDCVRRSLKIDSAVEDQPSERSIPAGVGADEGAEEGAEERAEGAEERAEGAEGAEGAEERAEGTKGSEGWGRWKAEAFWMCRFLGLYCFKKLTAV